jgi:hypothetical protein
MDAASGSQSARGEERSGVAHGLIVAILREVLSDRIVVGERTLFLREGQDCRYTPGTNLEVPYTVRQDGRSEVERISVVRPTR